MAIRENYNQDQTVITYEQTGRSTNTNELGMREMQARVYEKRNEHYLLVKAPPASGKSRANEARMTRLDKETGKRYVRRPELLRLYAGYKKDRDILLVRVRDVIYIPPYDIEYHLGPVDEYDVRA